MTESRQPGQGWSSGAGGDSWSAATYRQPQAEPDPPAANGDSAGGPTLQGFGEVSSGYGTVDFGSDSHDVALNTGWPAVLRAPAPASAPASVGSAPGSAPGPAVSTETARYDLAPQQWIDTSTSQRSNGGASAGRSGPSGPAAADEAVTCPECGTRANAVLNRRESRDFCAVCDYPLFWTPSAVIRDGSATDESLRRLPGTVGRATVASLACPHCSEPNAVAAQVCVRCGRSMHPVAVVAPPPAPVPTPRPEPVYEAPERGTPWWLWVLIAVAVVAIVTLLVLGATHVIG